MIIPIIISNFIKNYTIFSIVDKEIGLLFSIVDKEVGLLFSPGSHNLRKKYSLKGAKECINEFHKREEM